MQKHTMTTCGSKSTMARGFCHHDGESQQAILASLNRHYVMNGGVA